MDSFFYEQTGNSETKQAKESYKIRKHKNYSFTRKKVVNLLFIIDQTIVIRVARFSLEEIDKSAINRPRGERNI